MIIKAFLHFLLAFNTIELIHGITGGSLIMLKRLIAVLVVGAAVSSTGGCAFLRGSAIGSSFVTGDMWHLRLPGLAAPGQNAVGYRSPYGYEEYDRSTAGGRTEAISFFARRPGIALDISPDQLESLTRRWHFNGHDARLTWAQQYNRRIAGTSIVYRLYRRHSQGRAPAVACVAFMRTWGVAGDDPYLRPTRAYFGYHCRLPGHALSAATAQDYLRGIEVASSSVPGFYIGQTVPHDPAARVRASGTDDGAWGMVSAVFRSIGSGITRLAGAPAGRPLAVVLIEDRLR